MSHKHKTWAWLKPRPSLALVGLLSVVWESFALSRRRLRAQRGAVDAEGIGLALAIVGGAIAVGTLIGIFFIPVATFTVPEQQAGAILGIIFLVVGAITAKVA